MRSRSPDDPLAVGIAPARAIDARGAQIVTSVTVASSPAAVHRGPTMELTMPNTSTTSPPTADTPPTETPSPPTRLIPATEWSRHHPWPTLGGIRHLVYHRRRTGADAWARKIGRRLLIDEAAFFRWAESYGAMDPPPRRRGAGR